MDVSKSFHPFQEMLDECEDRDDIIDLAETLHAWVIELTTQLVAANLKLDDAQNRIEMYENAAWERSDRED